MEIIALKIIASLYIYVTGFLTALGISIGVERKNFTSYEVAWLWIANTLALMLFILLLIN